MLINKEEHNDLCVGIDLGTTNSVLATINLKPNGDIVSKVVEIPRAVDIYSSLSAEAKLSTQKRPILPSCVYYREENRYEPLVGDFAKRQYPLRPYLVAKSIKSQMGKPMAEGLSPDVPDKTPAQVSANILRHLLKNAEKIYRCKIEDAVITVPANFDSAMCKATRDAAELAGIRVKNSDGSERAVLLPEPNAVIYDLINQIHNGEISNHIIDLSTKKNVLVFDLGGGTLDITMHEIKRREDCEEVLKVSEIATNRYTLLGGDDFDQQIAEAMFERYLKQYEKHTDIVQKLKSQKKTIMPQLLNYAEQLKIELNEKCSNEFDAECSDGWEDEENEFSVGGNMGGIGYAYDDNFTQEEIEQILLPFLGEHLVFDDYKRTGDMTSKEDTRNIIYPILDVLQKATNKLQIEEVTVDAVIVNGGMSKFYMVIERLKKFFGFEPIVALDPDQAVARGAAVYHYYLHKYAQIQDDMRMVGEDLLMDIDFNAQKESGLDRETIEKHHVGIEFGKNILNDSLYLGVKNGAVHRIIPTGAELPYYSEIQSGFRLMPDQSLIAIPIKSKNLDGTYRTIAQGKMEFHKRYHEGAFVSFIVYMSSNKVITMKAWTSNDEAGKDKIEEGNTTIVINNEVEKGVKTRVVAPRGSILKPKEEINNLLQLCKNFSRAKSTNERSLISKKITMVVSNIISAKNPDDFVEEIIDSIRKSDDIARERLFVLARRMGKNWGEKDKRLLAQACMEQLNSEILGLSVGGRKISANIQAIYTLSMCANIIQLNKLSFLHDYSKYLQACLYTHGKTRTQVEWINEEFMADKKRAVKGISNNLQFSAYAIGMAFRKDAPCPDKIQQDKIVKELCEVVLSGFLTEQELICSILALGWICDQRSSAIEPVNDQKAKQAYEAIENIDGRYSVLLLMKCKRVRQVAQKMISGEELDEEEERFLLLKLEI